MTPIWLQFEVASLVIILVSIRGELLSAVLTAKELFSCMNSFVLKKTGLILKNFPTSSKWALIRVFELIEHFLGRDFFL